MQSPCGRVDYQAPSAHVIRRAGPPPDLPCTSSRRSLEGLQPGRCVGPLISCPGPRGHAQREIPPDYRPFKYRVNRKRAAVDPAKQGSPSYPRFPHPRKSVKCNIFGQSAISQSFALDRESFTKQRQVLESFAFGSRPEPLVRVGEVFDHAMREDPAARAHSRFVRPRLDGVTAFKLGLHAASLSRLTRVRNKASGPVFKIAFHRLRPCAWKFRID
jgi:hypothetical protein